MAGKASKPSFFWQGVLILLPVLLLALGSLASLRWDEQSAERAARQRAAQSVQSLAEVIPYTVVNEIQRFKALQDQCIQEMFFESRPDVNPTSHPKLVADVVKWEQSYPDLKLADLVTCQSAVMEDGRENAPPETPVVPTPPEWFSDLSPEQKTLWEMLGRKVAGKEDFRPAHKAFVDSGVSGDARQAATNLEERLDRHFGNMFSMPATEYSESGISFRGIAIEQMLGDPSIPLSTAVSRPFWSEVIQEPSFIAPMLLEMAEARTNGADELSCEKLSRIRRVWSIQAKAREWLAPLRDAPELRENQQPATFRARWTSGPAGEALAFSSPGTFEKMQLDSNGVPYPYSGNGRDIWFVPREVVEAIFAKAIARNRFLVPDFAEVSVAVAGRPLITPRFNGADRNHETLGTATGPFYDSYDPAKFEIKFLLADREQMLSAERHRARLFGLLILGAVAAAFIGFVMARRAFNTQLQLSEAKSNFVSSVSHELRAPIASVRLMAESLERGKVNEEQKRNEYFQFIVQECRRLSSLIENVLDFSRIEQGRKQYEFEPTDLAALVSETVKLMEPYAAERGVLLETSLPVLNGGVAQEAAKSEIRPSPRSFDATRNPKSELDLDGRAIQQALVNLMDNAIKHSRKESVVKVGLEYDACGARLWVEDNGPGIPPGEQEKIFERFYRLGSELRRETQGVGIGLSIVKHIVEAHGGNVTVRSNVGQGSRFTIELPATSNRSANETR